MKNEKAVMIIYACMKIISLFLGPFLVAYFVSVSLENIYSLSVFNIFNYLFLCLFGMITGYVIEKKGTLCVFRIGIIMRCLCVLLIMGLGINITTNYGVLSFVYGFSSMFLNLPFNLYHTEVVQNVERASFEFKLNIIKIFISVFIPVLLGFLISSTNYQLTASVILIFSIIQIIASFYLKPLPKSDRVYDLFGFLKKSLKDKQKREMLYVEFLNGLIFSDGVLGTIITILIMISFKSEFHLGVINSFVSFISLIFLFIYSKYYKGKDDKKIILWSGIFLFISMILFSFNISRFTVVFYNVIFGILGTGILTFVYGIRLFNWAKGEVGNNGKTEYWSMREIALNIGRVTGYYLLLIVSIFGIDCLKYLLVFLSFIVLAFCYLLMKIDKNEF